METIKQCIQVDSSKNLNANKYLIQEEYKQLVQESLNIISSLDVKDKYGKLIENGYTLILSILKMKKLDANISEQIEIIGSSKWLKLNKIWKRLRKLEKLDKYLTLE